MRRRIRIFSCRYGFFESGPTIEKAFTICMKKKRIFISLIFYAVANVAFAQCDLAFHLDSLRVIGMKDTIDDYYHDNQFYFSETEGYKCLEQGPLLLVYGKIENSSKEDVVITSFTESDDVNTMIIDNYQFFISIGDNSFKTEITTPVRDIWSNYFESKKNGQFIRSYSTIPFCIEVTPFSSFFSKRNLENFMELIQMGISFQDYLTDYIQSANEINIEIQRYVE